MQSSTCARTRSSRWWWIGRISSSGPLKVRERALDLFEVLVGAHDLAGRELGVRDVGPQHVDPVQRSLRVDLLGLALVGEGGVCDLHMEVFLDLVAAQRWTDRQADLISPGQRAALDTLSDLSQTALGRLQQLGSFAGALCGHERVAAHDQPLPRVVLGGDLAEVGLIEQRQLQLALAGELLDLRRFERRDPADIRLASSSWMLALVTIPRSETTTTRESPNRAFSLVIWDGSVLSSCSSPENTSTAIGRPGLSHNKPVDDLPAAALAVTRIPQGRQLTAAPLEIRRRHVVEHQLPILQVPARETILDPLLTIQKPVHRRVQIVLISIHYPELVSQRRLPERAHSPELRRRRDHPLADHRHHQVPLPRR